jgi:hypothetical protein
MVLSQKRQELVISKIRLCAKRKPACMAKQSQVDGSRAKKLSWTGSFSMFNSINANSPKPSTEVSGTACQILGMKRNHEARAQWNSQGNRQEGVNIAHRPLQITTHAGHTRSSTQLCIQYYPLCRHSTHKIRNTIYPVLLAVNSTPAMLSSKGAAISSVSKSPPWASGAMLLGTIVRSS